MFIVIGRLWSIPEIRECMIQAGFSKVKVWWKNIKQQIPTKQMKKLALDENTDEDEDENESEEDENEEKKDEGSENENEDDLSGDEMEDYIEVENVKQTKRWNAYVVGIL